MGRVIEREAAKKILGERDLKTLTSSERDDELYCMSAEDWSEHPLWATLPVELRNEIESGEIDNPEHSRFDQALSLYLAASYHGATNDFLLAEVAKIHADVSMVTGAMPVLESCPCCGLRSLVERAAYEICPVCWWEDDGQDNDDADEVFGGPNADISLTRARSNFLDHGIFDPRRTDLLSQRRPAKMFGCGRFFGRNKEGKVVELSGDIG